MKRVKATREGLEGQTTSTGYVIDRIYPFVALPSVRAKNQWVKIKNPLNGRVMCAQVKDTGPHYTDDDDYVFGISRPRAEIHTITNTAGIDLGESVWNGLGMKDNTEVEWEFVNFDES